MTIFGIHLADWGVLAAYFALILYLGVFVGAKQTKNLGDFFTAGGKWGALVSFIFVFASAVAGNEAVVVSAKAYEGGLSDQIERFKSGYRLTLPPHSMTALGWQTP